MGSPLSDDFDKGNVSCEAFPMRTAPHFPWEGDCIMPGKNLTAIGGATSPLRVASYEFVE